MREKTKTFFFAVHIKNLGKQLIPFGMLKRVHNDKDETHFYNFLFSYTVLIFEDKDTICMKNITFRVW